MKKIKFYAMALAALVIVSCSKEDVTSNIDPSLPGEQAQVTLQLKGTADDLPQVKAGGDGETSLEEAKINDIVVYFFRAAVEGNDAATLVDKTPTFKDSDFNNFTLTATTNAKSVYVIANTGLTSAEFATSDYAKVVTLADLKKLKGDLMKLEATQTSEKLFMAGGAADNITFVGTAGTAIVKLGFVASKIVVTIDDQRTNQNTTGWTEGTTNITINDKSIALLFAGKEGSFFGDVAAKIAQTAFYSGIQTLTQTNVTRKDILNTTIVLDGTKIKKENFYHFYTFAHQSALAHTGGGDNLPIVVTIVSEKKTTKNQVDPELTYYPVHFDAKDVLKTKDPKVFQPGVKYTLTVTLKGDVNKGEGGGTTDPEVPVVAADITVTVTVATWVTTIDVSKEFS